MKCAVYIEQPSGPFCYPQYTRSFVEVDEAAFLYIQYKSVIFI